MASAATLSLAFAAVTVPVLILLPTVVFYLEPSLVRRASWLLRMMFIFGIGDVGMATWYVTEWAWDNQSKLLFIGVIAIFVAFALLAWLLLHALIEYALERIYREVSQGQ